jgi:hypothetical protein
MTGCTIFLPPDWALFCYINILKALLQTHPMKTLSNSYEKLPGSNSMNDQINPRLPVVAKTTTSLQQLVNRLVSSLQERVIRNNSVIVNEVTGDIKVMAEENKVVSVISELLTTVVANSRNSSIHVTAERFRDTVLLNIQDRNNNNGYALAFSIMSMEPLAAEAGGILSIHGKQHRVATVSFSFPQSIDSPKYYC